MNAVRSEVLETAQTMEARRLANVILSVIPGARHDPGKIAVPPPPDPLFEWSPYGYPATVVCGDDDELASGFRSFGVQTVMPECDPCDLFVLAKAHRLTGLSYKGVFALAERAEWFVLMTETVQDWASGRVDFEQRADGGPSILGPIEWWINAIDNETTKMRIRHDLMWQANLLFRRQGVPRDLDTFLLYERQKPVMRTTSRR